jgi:hypothetical protein
VALWTYTLIYLSLSFFWLLLTLQSSLV